MEIAVLGALILINAFFALSEISLVTARRARLQPLSQAGDRAARIALQLGEDPTRFLSTIQIGITSVAMLSGIVGEQSLSPRVAAWLISLGLPAAAVSYVATAIVVLLITYFSIVIGELLPKRIGQLHAERAARIAAQPIQALALISKPFVWLLSGSTRVLLRLLRIDNARRSRVTEEEIHAVLAEGSAEGVIEEQEHRMVRNVFRLDDRPIVSFMTPRADIVSLAADADAAQLREQLESSPHSRYPVIRGDLQDVVGVVSARAILLGMLQGQALQLEQLVEPPLFVPQSVSGLDLLQEFRKSHSHLAFIVDEYGGILGLITLQDLVEAIAGEFASDSPDDAWAIRRDDGSWLLDGQIPIPELSDRLGAVLSREDAQGDFQTLSGLLLLRLGRVPRVTDTVQWQQWKFEIVDMDRNRIDKVLATPALEPQANDEHAGG